MITKLADAGKRLVEGVVQAWGRFPLAMVSALGVMVTLLVVIESGSNSDWVWQRVAMAAALGVPLGVFLVVAGESRDWTRGKLAALQAIGLGLVVAYWAMLPAKLEAVPESFWIRTAMLFLALHLAVAVGAKHRSHEAFWTFNWNLFSRYWVGVLYAVIFFAGLALALTSAVKLFDFTVEGERYGQLWVLITFGFHPLWLLAGVPKVRADEQAEAEPPRVLRVSAGGVLLPLVAVYLAILYPYAVKIALTRVWPDGWVAVPVIGLAVIGLLAVLLVQPLARAGLWWAEWFAGRWFGRLLVPMAVLLALAVSVRVGDYGLTESRYAGYVLAGWLAAMGLYFGTGGAAKRSLRVIPLSLLGVVVFLLAGPWSLFAVAERSQLARFDRLLAKYGLVEHGVARPKAQTLSLKEFSDLRSVIDYLHKRHQSAGLYARLDPWLKIYSARRDARWGFGSEALGWLQIASLGDDGSGSEWFWFYAPPCDLAGFKRADYGSIGYGARSPSSVGGLGLNLRLSSNDAGLEMESTDGDWKPVAEINAALKNYTAKLKTKTDANTALIAGEVVLKSGERRRIVLLHVEGRVYSGGQKLQLQRVDFLVLAP